MSAITHVLFDFFGTLVHYSDSRTEQGYERSHRVLHEAGSELAYDEFLASWSRTFSTFESRAQTSLEEYSMNDVCGAFLTSTLRSRPSQALLELFRDTYLEEWNTGVRDIPGLRPLLERLSGAYCLALVSNAHHADIVLNHLSRLELTGFFEAIVISIEHGRRKPSPCIFQRTLALTGGSADNALYVGDSYLADYVGATGAGLRCLLIDESSVHPVPAEARIASILELGAHPLTRSARA
jgi:putative hydrolase of the HAD superfamily